VLVVFVWRGGRGRDLRMPFECKYWHNRFHFCLARKPSIAKLALFYSFVTTNITLFFSSVCCRAELLNIQRGEGRL
jgi:hypothetical protein